jgi:hypothetical protein
MKSACTDLVEKLEVKNVTICWDLAVRILVEVNRRFRAISLMTEEVITSETSVSFY